MRRWGGKGVRTALKLALSLLAEVKQASIKTNTEQQQATIISSRKTSDHQPTGYILQNAERQLTEPSH